LGIRLVISLRFTGNLSLGYWISHFSFICL